MKKIFSSMGLFCLTLFAFTVIGCESVPWDLVASSLNTIGSSLQGISPSPGGSGSGSSSVSGAYNMTIVNNTGYTVYYVNVSHSSSDSWGNDVLGSSILSNGQSITVPLSRGGLWDIRLKDSDGDYYIKYNISANSRVVFTFSDFVRG